MRPIELQITGLNSFRERQTIQFEPLLAEGLFGIFGPTGSGKSSILDAITLALYGEVKRAPKGKGGIINMRERGCSVSFTFEVVVEGERKRYTIERLLEREKKKGGITTKRARLSEHRDGLRVPIAEKEKELDGRPQEPGKIQELIGLGADDFLRAVILPQGAFSNLLTLKPAERGEVMQRLFGLHDLGERLRSQLSLRGSEMETLLAGQGGRIAELKTYDDEALEACRLALEEALVASRAAEDRFELADRRLREAEELTGLLAEYERLVRAGQERARRQERLRDLRGAIDRAERGRLIHPALIAAENAAHTFARSEESYNLAVEASRQASDVSHAAMDRFLHAQQRHDGDHDPICEAIAALKRAAEGIEERRRREEERRELDRARAISGERLSAFTDAHGARAAAVAAGEREHEALDLRRRELRVAPEERERHERIRELVREEALLEASLATRRESAAGQGRELELLERTLAGASSGESECRARVAALESALAAAREQLARRVKERDGLREHYRIIDDVQKDIGHLRTQIDEQQQDRTRKVAELQRFETELQRSMMKLDRAIDERRMAQERLDAARELLVGIERRTLLATIASELEDGLPCPLCGSHEHPTPHAEAAHTVEEVEIARHAVASREMEMRQAEAGFYAVSEGRVKLNTERDTAQGAIGQIDTRIVALRAQIDEKLAAVGVVRPVASIEGLRILSDDTKQAGIAAAAEIERLTSELAAIESELASARTTLTDLASSTAALVARREEMRRTLEAAEREAGELSARRDALRSRLAADANGRTLDGLREELERLAERDREAEAVEKESDESGRALKTLREERDAAAAELAEARRAHEGNVARLAQLDAELERHRGEIDAMLAALPDGYRASDDLAGTIRHAEERRDMLRRELEETRTAYDAARTEARVREVETKTQWTTHCGNEVERDRLERDLRLQLEEQGFAGVEELRRSMLDLPELRRRKEESDAIEAELREARRKLDELAGAIAGRTIDERELADIRQAQESARRERDLSIAASGAAERSYTTCVEKNAELRRALEQQQEVEQRAATIEQLRRYLTGNAFVNYLADERLAEVCRRASLQLESLTGGRLELCTRSSDGFYIRDHGNGGGERSTSSLSGGETFLVSLSLALALSDTIQLGRSPLEFFFLDEGFGTLDHELLETVLDSLDRLRSQHRAIGVISHVGALRERINRRLVIAPASGDRGSTVTYELA